MTTSRVAMRAQLARMLSVERLPLEEELRLARRAKRGHKPSLERLLHHNVRHVATLAMRFARRSQIAVEDFVGEGAIGLARAVEGFDPSRGLRFITYAVPWIRLYMQRMVDAEYSRGAPTGGWPAQIRRTVAACEARGASFDEMAWEVALVMDWSEAKARDTLLRLLARHDLSFDAPAAGLDDTPLGEVFDAGGERLDDAVVGAIDAEARARTVRALVARLPARERAILEARYLNEQEHPATLESMGVRFGCTRERARQLEERAMARIGRAFGLTELEMKRRRKAARIAKAEDDRRAAAARRERGEKRRKRGAARRRAA